MIYSVLGLHNKKTRSPQKGRRVIIAVPP